MKILYHHRIRSKDGQYVHVEELTNALRRAGHNLIFVGPRVIERETLGADAGFVAWLKRHLPHFIYELLELSYSVFDFLQLAKAIRLHRPDCIYERYNLFLPSGIWIKKLFRLPLLLEVNAPLFAERLEYDGITLKRLARSVERYTWRGADFVLPVTEVLARIVEMADVQREKIQVIPNGIDADRFASAPEHEQAKAALNLTGKFVLGFAGFVREWHGLDRVLEFLAAEQLPDLHLLLVGNGPALRLLEQKANELGVAEQLTVTGVIERGDMARYMAAFDVALQPNVVAYASPLKLFEYLAMGHAIIAPDTQNIREILRDGENALLFDAESDEDFFRCMRRLKDEATLRKQIAAGASGTINELGLTWDRNAERVCRLFLALGINDHIAKDRAPEIS